MAKNIQITANKKVRNTATSIALAVQNENRSNTVIFTLPRYTNDNEDLSLCDCYVDYENSANQSNRLLLSNPTISADSIIYNWILDNMATAKNGDFFIQISFEKDDFSWKSERGKFLILESIAFGKQIDLDGTTILHDLMAQVQDHEERITYIEQNGGGGGGDDKYFLFHQYVPSNTWTINHTLNKFPSVTIIDSGGTHVYGNIDYISTNQVILTFTNEFSGEASLN